MSKFTLNTDKGRARVLENLVRFLQSLPDNKAWTIEIKAYRKSRSDDQNAALWGVAYPPLCEHTGYRPEEIHEVMCMEFFGRVDDEILGQHVVKPARTTTTGFDGRRDVIGTAEFVKFYEYIQQRGAELGVFIPSPERAAA
jgi:hypothetical protein